MSRPAATSTPPRARVADPTIGIVASRSAADVLGAVLLDGGLELANGDGPDVLVVAVASPTLGERAVRDARAEHPGARIVLVVESSTPAEARQSLVDDVPGLVFERDAADTLAVAVRAVSAGLVSYPSELMPTQLRESLSKREKQMLGMVVLGFSNAEIAGKLHVSESTVKSHLHSAFATLGVRTRKQAVALILDPEAGFGTGILAITQTG